MASDRKLTVLQMLPALNAGGVERGALEVGRYLSERGHRSLVMSAGGRMVDQLTREGSEHFSWPIGKKSLWTLRLLWKLRRFMVEQHVDILHVRSRMPAWVAYLAWKGMDPATRPHFITTVHGLYSVNPYSAVMTRGERVIATSESVRHYVLNNYPGVDPSIIRVIFRGIDPADYRPDFHPDADWLAGWQAQYPHLQGKRLVTLPGRLTRLKGHEDFIRLIARLGAMRPDVHGLIVGGHDARQQGYVDALKTAIHEHGLQDRITFVGHRQDLREIFSQSALVVSLSNKPESFGRTVLEALSLGVPVAGYAHGGVGEILAALYPRGMAPLGDLEKICEACERGLEDGRIAPETSPFQLRSMLEATEQVYCEVTQ